MGADLYAGDSHFRDAYNTYGLMSVLSGTLEAGSHVNYSWWKLADKFTMKDVATSQYVMTDEQLKGAIDFFENALVEMLLEPTWRYGYDSGAPLSTAEKEQHLATLKELLSFLQFARHTETTVIWSV